MSNHTPHLPREAALSLIVLSMLTGGARAASEVKTPVPPPTLEDIKTPAPPRPYQETSSEPLPIGPLQLNEGQAEPAPRLVGTGYLAGMDATRVYFDQPGDGAIWAVGNRYKASFDANGATYVPFFGSRAPRCFPLHLRIEAITIGGAPVAFDASAQPVHAGNRIVFDRGLVDEVYDLSPDSIEQSFVFERMPLQGELVVRLAVDTELARDIDTNGLVFSGELGSVHYSHAVSFDETGVRHAAPTAFEGDAITLRVPAEQVAEARGALVIDPVLSTVAIDNDTWDSSLPDVAYDASTARYLAVYEIAFSSTDHDVFSREYTSLGVYVAGSELYVDASLTYWGDPKVANNGLANQFLTVAEVGDPAGGSRDILGRTRSATGTTQSNQFVIDGAETGDKHNPDVGGDPYLTGPTYYCVVWQRNVSDTDSDVHARLVESNSSTIGGTIFLSNSPGTLDNTPAISKTDGQGPASLQRWNIAWTRSFDLFSTDLYAAQIDWDGTITTAFPVDTTSASTHSSSPSSLTEGTPRRWLLSYTRSSSAFSDPEIYGRLMQDGSTIDTADLTALSGAPSGEIQSAASADCDGAQFVVANNETVSGDTALRNIYISTFSTFGDQLLCPEGHTALALSSALEDEVEIVCAGSAGGPTRRTFAAWHQETSSGNGDIEGALYETGTFTIICQPGLDGVNGCPCGNFPSFAHRGCDNSAGTGGARLTPAGDTSPDTVTLTASGMMPTGIAIFLQGNGVSDTGIVDGVAFGDGLRCIGGQLLRLGVKSITSGVATYPSGTDLGIKARSSALGDTIATGTKRYYQTYYRDAATFACAFPSTFNISDGVQIDW